MEPNVYKIECESQNTCGPNGWFVEKLLNYQGHLYLNDFSATIYTKDSPEKVEAIFKTLEPSACCVKIERIR